MESKFLKWDSDFFGFNVATIKSMGDDETQIADEINKFQNEGCQLIYVFTPQKLSLTGFNTVLADKKRCYILPPPI